MPTGDRAFDGRGDRCSRARRKDLDDRAGQSRRGDGHVVGVGDGEGVRIEGAGIGPVTAAACKVAVGGLRVGDGVVLVGADVSAARSGARGVAALIGEQILRVGPRTDGGAHGLQRDGLGGAAVVLEPIGVEQWVDPTRLPDPDSVPLIGAVWKSESVAVMSPE